MASTFSKSCWSFVVAVSLLSSGAQRGVAHPEYASNCSVCHGNAAKVGSTPAAGSMLDFGKVLVGNSKSLNLTISNVATVSEGGGFTGEFPLAAGPFARNGNGTFTTTYGGYLLPPKVVSAHPDGVSKATKAYSYQPAVRGANSSSLSFTPSDGFPAGLAPTLNFSLKGQGVAPVVSLDSTSMALGAVRIGSSATAHLTVKNTGDGNLAGAGLGNLSGSVGAADGGFSGAGGSFNLADNTARSFDFVFAPVAHATASSTVAIATLNGSDDNTNQAQKLSAVLSGTGVGPTLAASVAPGAAIEFTSVDHQPAVQSLAIRNATLDADLGALTNLSLLSAAITGADAGLFSLVGFTPGATLSKSQSSDVQIRFSAAAGATLPASATLTILTDEGATLGSAGKSVAFSLTGIVAIAGSEWSSSASGAWSNAANWTGGVPNAAGATANLKAIPSGPVTVTVDAPQTVGTINLSNAHSYTVAGAHALTLNAAATAAINVTQGNHTIAAPLTLAQATTIDASGGNLTLSGPLNNSAGKAISKLGSQTLTISGLQTHGAGSSLTVSGGVTNIDSNAGLGGATLAVQASGLGAAVNFNSTQNLAAISVKAGSQVNLGPSAAAHPPYAPGGKFVQTKSLSIDAASGSSLDVADNVLVIDYTGGASPLAQVTNYLTQGFNSMGTIWDGPGLKSSSARDDAQFLTSLGVIDNADIGYDHINGNQFNFGGAGDALPTDSVLVKWTYGGDTDLNGVVDGDDLVTFNVGFLNHLNGWANGDFDYSGAVDGDDLTVLLVSYANQAGALAAGAGAKAVPEPSPLVLLGLAVAGAALAARRMGSLPQTAAVCDSIG